jgi:hypothetical protein
MAEEDISQISVGEFETVAELLIRIIAICLYSNDCGYDCHSSRLSLNF